MNPLVRLTCYDQLSTARRRLLHTSYADAVLRNRPDALDTLAVHLTRADDPRAIGYLRQAAERRDAKTASGRLTAPKGCDSDHQPVLSTRSSVSTK